MGHIYAKSGAVQCGLCMLRLMQPPRYQLAAAREPLPLRKFRRGSWNAARGIDDCKYSSWIARKRSVMIRPGTRPDLTEVMRLTTIFNLAIKPAIVDAQFISNLLVCCYGVKSRGSSASSISSSAAARRCASSPTSVKHHFVPVAPLFKQIWRQAISVLSMY